MGKKILLIFVLFVSALHAQTYTMQDGTFTTCSGVFYDSGGASGGYAPNETYQITFCPATPGKYIQLDFSAFDIESTPQDNMTVYEGSGTAGPVIGSYGGFDSPISACGGGSIVSSDPSGCLTVVFVSNASVEYTGWVAAISCSSIPGGTNPPGPANAVCSGANPFCANAGPLEFPNISSADCVPPAPAVITGNTCLGSVPNPAWYYLEIDNSGDLILEIKQTTGQGGTGTGLDVDYAIWGPYSNTSSACSSFTLGNVVACSYSVAAIETANIPGAVTGQIYMVLITNFNGASGYITMTQTNAGGAGAGSTDCTIVCPVAVGNSPSCGASDGFFTISGLDPSTAYTITYSDDGTPKTVSLISNASGHVVVGGLDAGNYTNILTSFPGCNAAPSSVTLVTGVPPTFTSVTGNPPICSGGDAVFTLTGTANAVVSYTINSGAVQTITLNGSGTATVTVNAVTANTTMDVTQISNPGTGCTASVSASKVVIVKTLPTVNINYAAAPFCTGTAGTSPVTLTGTGIFSGGSYSSSPSGLVLNTSTGAILPSGSTPGNYLITYTIPAGGGCPAVTALTMITVTAKVTASISYPASAYCTGASPQNVTITGTGTFSGGIFSAAPAGLGIDSVSGTITPSGSSAGNYTITYFIPGAGGCGNVSVTASVVIATDATATINYSGPTYCTSQGPQGVTLTGIGAFTGGTYSSSPAGLILNSVSGTITPSGSLGGDYTITYTLSATGSCPPSQATTLVTIIVGPTVSLSYGSTSFCTNAGVENPTLSGTGAYTGGTYSASPAGLDIDPVTGDITPANSAPGNYIVSYTVPSGGPCPPVQATKPITIKSGITASISYTAASYCKSAVPQSVTLTGTGTFTGGSYAVAPVGLVINSVTGKITPATSAPGNYTVTYTVSAGAGCGPVQALASITIITSSTASINYSSASFCSSTPNEDVTLSGTGTFTGGTFSAAPAGLTIDTATGTITPAASTVGNYMVTYTIPAISGCGPVIATKAVTIVASTTVSLSFSAVSYCVTDSLQNPILSGTGNYTGGTYSSSPLGLDLDALTGVVTPASSTPGNYTVNYDLPAAGDCPAINVSAAVAIAVPATASISYPAVNYCTTALPQNVTLNGTGAYIGGTFSASPAGLTMNSATGLITPATSATGNYIITYTISANGGCAPVLATAAVDIAKEATVAVSYATGSYCTSSAPENIIISGTGPYTGGVFTSDLPGLVINNATGTITPSASSPGTYTVTYSIPTNGGCGAVQDIAVVTIDAEATAAISYASPSYCNTAAPENVVLTGTGPFTGGSFSVTPPGLSIDTVTGLITPSTSTAGNYTVAYSLPSNGSCPPVVATATVEISEAATATIGYASPGFCTTDSDQPVTLAGTGSFAGGSFSASPPGLLIDSVTGLISPASSSAGNYTINYSAAGSAGCSPVDATASVIISESAAANISYPSAGFCTTASDQSVTLTGTGAFTGGTFSAVPAGLSVDFTTGTVSPGSSSAGTYTITYSAPGIGSCNPVSATTSVDISVAATANISYTSSAYCTNAVDQLATLTGTGSFSGGTFTSLPVGLTIDSATGTISPATSSAGSYTITYSAAGSGGCSAVSASAMVDISAGATASISYSSAGYCTTAADQSVTLTGTGTFTGGTFTATPAGLSIDSATGMISPATSSPGNYTIAYSAAGSGSCGNVNATASVDISASATANISYTSATFCTNAADQLATLTGTGSFSGGTFTSLPVGLTIDSATGTISPATSSAGSYTITYSAAGSGGCSPVSASATVDISTGATANISYSSAGYCTTAADQSATLTGTGTFTGGTFTATPAGLSIDSATGMISPAISSPGSYTIAYSAAGSGSCGNVNATALVDISASATANISYTSATYCTNAADQLVTLTGTGSFSGGTFTSLPVGLTIDSATGTISPATSNAGSYTITYSAAGSGGCSAVSASAMVDISAGATANISYSSAGYCTTAGDQSATLTGTGTFTGGTFTATPAGLSIDSATGMISPAISSPGSYTITYSAAGSGSCGNVNATASVDISASATANISYTSATYCTNAADQLVTLTGTGSFSGGTFTSLPVGLTIDSATGTISPATSSAGSYTITYSAAGSGGCSPVSASATVDISTGATANISYSSAGYCTTAADQSATLTGTGTFTGGAFTATPAGLSIDAATGMISPATSSPGNYTIAYSAAGSGSCGNVNATALVDISASATANISYTSATYCTNAADQLATLTGTGSFSGGTFTSLPAGLTIDSASGTISPATSSAGSYTITYSAAGSGGCSPVSASVTVDISIGATANISYSSAGYCTTAGDQSATLTGTGTFTGGTFTATPAGLSIDAATGMVSPASSNAGNYTITYAAAGSPACGAVNATATVNIGNAATAAISYAATDFCTNAGDQSVALTGTGSFSGGVFSSAPAGLTIDPATGMISTATSTAGNYTVTYSAPGSGGCGNVSAAATVNISAAPTATISYPFINFCISTSSQNVILNGTGAFTGGTFSATPAGLTIDTLTGTITPSTSATGSYMITYGIPTIGGCQTIPATIKINISDDAAASISYTAAGYCTGAGIQDVTISGSGLFMGGVFTAVPGGLSIDPVTGTISPGLSAAGNYTISYNAPGSPGCGPVNATTTVSITQGATVLLSYASPGFCSTDGSQSAAVSGTGLITGGLFTAQPAGLAMDGTSGVITPASSQPGSYVITYITPANGNCGTSSATATVSISTAATASIAYPATGFCTASAVQNATLMGTGPYTGGTFSALPAGLSINAINGMITPGASAPGNYTVTYSTLGNGSCGAVSASATVSISALPTAVISYPAAAYCTSFGSQAITLAGTGPYTGGSYSSAPAGLTINPATGAITPSSSTPGSYAVTYMIPGNGICGAVSAAASITIIPPPTAAITYTAASYCPSEAPQHVSLTGTGGYTGGTYSANLPGLTINPLSGIITPGTSAAGNYTITYATPATGGCGAVLASTSVIIYPKPVVTATADAGSLCSGESDSVALSSLVPGTTFTWTVTQNGVSGASGGTGDTISNMLSVTGNNAGTAVYTITPSANGCTGTPVNVTITVNPIPEPELSSGSICIDPKTGATMQDFVLDTGLDDATHDFQWFNNSLLIADALTSTYTATEPGTYSVIATSSAGCVSAEVSAVVSAVTIGTTITISGNIEFADNAHVTVSVNGNGTYEYQLDGGSFGPNNSFDHLAPGIHTITVRDTEGCTDLFEKFNVIGYPHYFTPNGDEFHDTWNIWSLIDQEYSRIFIFDRYGKLLKEISPGGPGWDGTYNGEPLPSTDYWFLVQYGEPRPNKEFRAHFSLKR